MVSRTAADVSTGRVHMMKPAPVYGMELVLDLHDCDHTLFNRPDLKRFFKELLNTLDMEAGPLHFWDYLDNPQYKDGAPPHMKGTTAVQFIFTSNITIHTLDDLRRVYVNIFSCREFDVQEAVEYTTRFFGAGWCGQRTFQRS